MAAGRARRGGGSPGLRKLQGGGGGLSYWPLSPNQYVRGYSKSFLVYAGITTTILSTGVFFANSIFLISIIETGFKERGATSTYLCSVASMDVLGSLAVLFPAAFQFQVMKWQCGAWCCHAISGAGSVLHCARLYSVLLALLNHLHSKCRREEHNKMCNWFTSIVLISFTWVLSILNFCLVSRWESSRWNGESCCFLADLDSAAPEHFFYWPTYIVPYIGILATSVYMYLWVVMKRRALRRQQQQRTQEAAAQIELVQVNIPTPFDFPPREPRGQPGVEVLMKHATALHCNLMIPHPDAGPTPSQASPSLSMLTLDRAVGEETEPEPERDTDREMQQIAIITLIIFLIGYLPQMFAPRAPLAELLTMFAMVIPSYVLPIAAPCFTPIPTQPVPIAPRV